jgi:hypothetical protein
MLPPASVATIDVPYCPEIFSRRARVDEPGTNRQLGCD